MPHLDEEQVQRLLHRELPGAMGSEARAHVAACATCRARLGEAEQEEARVMELLRRLDHPVPAVAAPAVAARAARWTRPAARWAASVTLVLAAAGVAYAAPGSPLREWVDRALAWVAGEEPVESGLSGVAVAPGERFTIVFTPAAGVGVAGEGVAIVALTDGPHIAIRTPDVTTRFTTEAGRLIVTTGDSAAGYELDVPRDASWVEIWADGRRLLLKQGARVVTDAPVDSAGRYVLRLGPS